MVTDSLQPRYRSVVIPVDRSPPRLAQPDDDFVPAALALSDDGSVLTTVDFHGSRPWTCEVAVWDLVGRAVGEPVWQMLGGRNEALTAYASTGERVEIGERVRRCHGNRAGCCPVLWMATPVDSIRR